MEVRLTVQKRRAILVGYRCYSEWIYTHQLVIGDLRSVFVKHEPPSITRNCGNANIGSNDHISDEEPFGHQWFSAVPRRYTHYRVIRGVES
jgi:hypothetical protein